MDGVAIKGGLIFLDDSVLAIDSHPPVIVRDRKGKSFPVKLFFALHSSVKFDGTSYGASHTVSILSICYVESRGAALDLACEKWKVHSIGCDEKGGIIDTTDEGIELVELLVCKRGSPESNGEIRLRPWTLHCYTACPAFVNTLNQMVEICGPVGGECFCRRDNQSRDILDNPRFVSVLDLSISHFKRSSRNSESLGTSCSDSKRHRQRLLLASVIPRFDLSIKLPLAAINVV